MPRPADDADIERNVAEPALTLRPVLKAYEQVADQLRESILTGKLVSGQRLPNERQLAADLGVSRTTVREALRVLVAENLIRTEKGASGGSIVTLPTVDHIAEYLKANTRVLLETETLTLDDFLLARVTLEVPAARLAAENRSDEDLDRLRDAMLPGRATAYSTDEHFAYNRDYHALLFRACHSTLLTIAVQPTLYVLQTYVLQSALTPEDHEAIQRSHQQITEAIEQRDPDRAAKAMEDHLEEMVPMHTKGWKLLDRRVAGR